MRSAGFVKALALPLLNKPVFPRDPDNIFMEKTASLSLFEVLLHAGCYAIDLSMIDNRYIVSCNMS